MSYAEFLQNQSVRYQRNLIQTPLALLICMIFLLTGISYASNLDPYTPYKGKNIVDDFGPSKQGKKQKKKVKVDDFGNPAGPKYDLARDGAFVGHVIAVLHLYTGEGFDFRLPKLALEEKGFEVRRWKNMPPRPEYLARELETVDQLWIISDRQQKLKKGHLDIIRDFFNSGRGLYLWGDNQPYYADANYVARAILGTSMHGSVKGNQVVGLRQGGRGKGLMPNHLLTTGIQNIYEGITIATINPGPGVKPLLYGSSRNLVTAYYDQGGKRAIVDGGSTRLFHKWDTAGTGRYVKNAAAWLNNYERFWKRSLPGIKAHGPRLIAALLDEEGLLISELQDVDFEEIKLALLDFQTARGLRQTGRADEATWNILRRVQLSPERKRELERLERRR